MRSSPILLASLLTAGSLASGPPDVAQPPAAQAATPNPGSIAAVIAVRDAARTRSAPAAAPVLELAKELLGIERLPAAWSGLAQQLALEPEQAFDQLLGRRSVLVLGTPVDGQTPWTLLSEIAPDAVKRLREKLNPAPRSITDGTPVFSLEHGAYELTMRASASEPADSGWTTAVLSPTGRPAIPMPASLSTWMFPVHGMGEEASKHADLLAYYRDKETGFWAVNASFEGSALAGRVAASPGLFGIADRDVPAGKPKTPDFSALPADDIVLDIEGVLPQLPSSPTELVAKQAASVFGALGIKGPDESIFGRRISIRLETSKKDGQHRRTFLLAAEVPDAAKAVAECDRFMTELLHVAPGGDANEPRAAIALDGKDPFACRVATLKGVAGQPSTVAWMVVKSPTEDNTPASGYWCMSFAAGPADAERDFRALVDHLEADRRAWPRPVLRVNLRPSQLLGADRPNDTRSPLVTAWRGVDIARLELWRTNADRIDGHISVQMLPTQPAAMPALADPPQAKAPR